VQEDNGRPLLDEAEIAAIVDRLRRGQYLDDHLRERLFRQPKEAEVVYSGKASEGEVLAETMAVPLQTLKAFGDAGGGWSNKLVFGNNLQVLKTLLDMKERGELRNGDGSPGVRLCYIDPPFATLREFGEGRRRTDRRGATPAPRRSSPRSAPSAPRAPGCGSAACG
jgi:hypothetical protein